MPCPARIPGLITQQLGLNPYFFSQQHLEGLRHAPWKAQQGAVRGLALTRGLMLLSDRS